MYMQARFFTRKEEEPKLTFTEHCRTHMERILQTDTFHKADATDENAAISINELAAPRDPHRRRLYRSRKPRDRLRKPFSTGPLVPLAPDHRRHRRGYNENTTKSHSLYDAYEKMAPLSADFPSSGPYMTYMKVVQYSGSSVRKDVEVRVFSRAVLKHYPEKD